MAVTQWDPSSTDGEVLTVSSSLFDTTLTNYLLYFNLSILDSTLLSNARGDYKDINFYLPGSGTRLDRIVLSNGTCLVRLPSASSSVSTIIDVNSGSGVSTNNDSTCLSTSGHTTMLTFDESSGNPSDLSGNYSPVASGVTYTQTGKIGTSFGFNDLSSYVRISTAPTQLSNATTLSWGTWVNFNDLLSENEVVFSVIIDATNRIQINKGAIGKFQLQLGNATTQISGQYDLSTLTAGQFCKIDMVYNQPSGYIRLFANGALWTPTSATGSLPASTGDYSAVDFYIGNNFNQNLAVGGYIDMPYINSGALSNDYIKARYNNENDYASYVSASEYTAFATGGNLGSIYRGVNNGIYRGAR